MPRGRGGSGWVVVGMVAALTVSSCTADIPAPQVSPTSPDGVAVRRGDLTPTVTFSAQLVANPTVVVQAPTAGLYRPSVRANQGLRRGQPLATVGDARLATPVDGIVSRLPATPGQQVPRLLPLIEVKYASQGSGLFVSEKEGRCRGRRSPSPGECPSRLKSSSRRLSAARWPQQGGPVADSIVDVRVVAGDVPGMFRLPLVSGRWLSDDAQTAPLEAVVNEAAASEIGTAGQRIAVVGPGSARALPVQVVGVVNDARPHPQVYLKAGPAARNAPQWVSVTGLTLRWHAAGLTLAQVADASRDFAADRSLPSPSEPQRVDTVDDLLPVIGSLQAGFALAAVLTLTVAALGLLNVGLASLHERSRELVIRRALGASRASVVRLVLGSTLLLSLLVAAAAITVGALVVAAYGWSIPANSPVDPPVFPWQAGLAGAAAAVVTALAGSLVPAIAAGRVQPADALRA